MTTKLHVTILLTIVTQFVTGVSAETAGTNAPILLRLSDANISFPPPIEFLHTVVAETISAFTNAPAPVVVVSSNATVRLYAAILMASFPEYAIHVSEVSALSKVPLPPDRKMRLAGNLSAEDKSFAESAGIQLVPVPQRNFHSKTFHRGPGWRTRLIVLGNEPLDERTPTVDMIKRVIYAADFAATNINCSLLMTGGSTASSVSEACMMGLIAMSRGVPSGKILLEERALSTRQNAVFSAELLESRFKAEKTYVVSKPDHLKWAMPFFHEYSVFSNAVPLPVTVPREEIIAQMERYLRVNGSPRVRARMRQVMDGVQGVD